MAGMKPSDIARLVHVEEVALSPDGRYVAFTVTTIDAEANDYRNAVWVGSTDGSAPAMPFTAGDTPDRIPRWSPDGRFLAFVSGAKDDDDGGALLNVAPVATGGEVRAVCRWKGDIDDVAWSPDGNHIAFGARAPDEQRQGKKVKDQPPRRLTRLFSRVDTVGWLVDRPRRVYVMRADGVGEPRGVTTGDADDQGLAWTPDGRALVHVAARHDRWDLDLCNDVWVTPVDGGDSRRITHTDQLWQTPVVSPDGSQVAAFTYGDPWEIHHAQLAVIDLADGSSRSLTAELDRPAEPFGVSGKPVWVGEHIVFAVEDHGDVHLYRVRADGSASPEVVVGGEQWVVAFTASADAVAVAVATTTELPEVDVHRDGGRPRRLTSLGAAFAEAVEAAGAERFTATSSDGTEVQGWFIAPVGVADGVTFPALLNVHGGPFTQYGNKFFDEFQIQAGAGYGVIFCNPRGSSGYGEAWGQAVAWPEHPTHPGSGWGTVDAEDLLAVLDEAYRRFPAIDANRVGVLGGSYGGYMTTWLAAHHGARFRAGCTERAANDIVGLEASSDIATAFRSYTGVTHYEHPSPLERHSPLAVASKIELPLLIVHSEGDLRCPIDQADALFTVLRLREQPVEFLRFSGESHELSRSGAPKHRIQRAEAILEWFSRWL